MNPKIETICTWIEDNDIAGDFVVCIDPDPSSRDWVARIYNGDGEELHSHHGEEILFGRGPTEAEAIDWFMEGNGI